MEDIMIIRSSFMRRIISQIINKALKKQIFGPGDERDTGEPEPTPQAPKAEAVVGWEGGPPYRYIDVSRYQGKITLDGWRKVKAAGYKGAMLKTVSTNRKLSKRADGLYIDPTFETNYRNAKAAGLDVGVYYYREESNTWQRSITFWASFLPRWRQC